jgi:hypothetical protein
MAEDNRNDNLARLIAASAGPESRPDRAVRAATFRLLIAEMRRLHPVQFPDAGLALLSAGLACMALILIAGTGTTGPRLAGLIAIAANLVIVPVAAIVIVWRRRCGWNDD